MWSGAKERTASAQLSPPRSHASRPAPRSLDHSKVQSLESYSCALFFPLSAKAYQYFDPNQLPHFLIFTRVQNRTHDPVRAPETPCRLAYFVTLSQSTREQGGGAERAEGARSHAKKTLVQILYGSVAYQRVKNEGRVRSRRFHLHPGERRVGWVSAGPEYEAALR